MSLYSVFIDEKGRFNLDDLDHSYVLAVVIKDRTANQISGYLEGLTAEFNKGNPTANILFPDQLHARLLCSPEARRKHKWKSEDALRQDNNLKAERLKKELPTCSMKIGEKFVEFMRARIVTDLSPRRICSSLIPGPGEYGKSNHENYRLALKTVISGMLLDEQWASTDKFNIYIANREYGIVVTENSVRIDSTTNLVCLYLDDELGGYKALLKNFGLDINLTRAKYNSAPGLPIPGEPGLSIPDFLDKGNALVKDIRLSGYYDFVLKKGSSSQGLLDWLISDHSVHPVAKPEKNIFAADIFGRFSNKNKKDFLSACESKSSQLLQYRNSKLNILCLKHIRDFLLDVKGLSGPLEAYRKKISGWISYALGDSRDFALFFNSSESNLVYRSAFERVYQEIRILLLSAQKDFHALDITAANTDKFKRMADIIDWIDGLVGEKSVNLPDINRAKLSGTIGQLHAIQACLNNITQEQREAHLTFAETRFNNNVRLIPLEENLHALNQLMTFYWIKALFALNPKDAMSGLTGRWQEVYGEHFIPEYMDYPTASWKKATFYKLLCRMRVIAHLKYYNRGLRINFDSSRIIEALKPYEGEFFSLLILKWLMCLEWLERKPGFAVETVARQNVSCDGDIVFRLIHLLNQLFLAAADLRPENNNSDVVKSNCLALLQDGRAAFVRKRTLGYINGTSTRIDPFELLVSLPFHYS